MPTPKTEESRKEFLKRCIPIIVSEGKKQEQAIAQCSSIYNQSKIDRSELIFTMDQEVRYPHLLKKKYPSDTLFDADEQYKLTQYVLKDEVLDALQGNFESILGRVSNTMEFQKQDFGIVIDKFVQETFDEGVRTVERELSRASQSLFDTDKSSSTTKVLKDNMKVITFELMDSVNKEITLFLTNIELNNIPFTNAGLKAEVKRIFQAKTARLASQVITESNRIANTGLKFGYDQSGVITHKQWVAVIDSKTTRICLSGNGEIRQIGEPFSTGDFGAPFHINCRSRIVGLTVSEAGEQGV